MVIPNIEKLFAFLPYPLKLFVINRLCDNLCQGLGIIQIHLNDPTILAAAVKCEGGYYKLGTVEAWAIRSEPDFALRQSLLDHLFLLVGDLVVGEMQTAQLAQLSQ